MRQFEAVEEAYDICVASGDIIPSSKFDEERVKAGLRIAEEDLQSAKDAVVKERWNSAYKMHYDVLHQLAETFLKLENIKAKTHLCLFAYLCVKHPELELNWDFFERVRTKRNGINYYGTPVTERDWKEAALEFQLNIDLFKMKIKERLEKVIS